MLRAHLEPEEKKRKNGGNEMIVTKDAFEAMVENLRRFNADQVKYKFELKKDNEPFVFEMSLKRGTLVEDEDEDE